jgi:hydrogenase maturation factor
MKVGKLPLDMLASMLAKLPAGDESVLVGPRVGEDAAAIAFSDRVLVAGMDPITFATDLIGWYAVQVNANDIAVMGARPRWLLAALLLPPDASESLVAPIFDQLARGCAELEIALIGGHTEVTPAVSQPVIVGCMLGEVESGRVVTTSGARPGDAIILSGPAGIEGTALLAREAGDALRQRGLADDALARACQFLFDPGISVVRAALMAASAGVTAMHDPTEGGIATGLLELARASGAGLEVDANRIPVLPLTSDICQRLDLDPLGLIASGALLVTAPQGSAEAVLGALSKAGAEGVVIGRMLPASDGLTTVRQGRIHPLPEFERDEVARFLEAQSSTAEQEAPPG